MLYLFDLDGTLISSYMDNPDRNFHAWSLLPGRAEKIAALLAEGNQIGVISNQASVAFGYNSETDVEQKLCAVGAALGYGWIELHDGGESRELATGARNAGVLSVHVCYTHPRASVEAYQDDNLTSDRRKPSPAMIHEARAGENTIRVVFIGDSQEDAGAARNAGVAFQWAKDFFSI